MSVHVGEISTEVVAAPSRSAAATPDSRSGEGDGSSPWPAVERLRALAARLEREEARLRARGFDD